MDEERHVAVDLCDYNDNGSIDYCELHKCIEEAENAYRDERWENTCGKVACICEEPIPYCEGAISCH